MATKRRRHGTVEAPSLDELLTPNKRLRVEDRLHPPMASDWPHPPGEWTVDELSEYLQSVGLSSTVVSLLRGGYTYCILCVDVI